jgi:hypothetical protein
MRISLERKVSSCTVLDLLLEVEAFVIDEKLSFTGVVSRKQKMKKGIITNEG